MSNNSLTPEADALINRLLKEGNKIAAIKEYREATGCDLRTAKDAIDNWSLHSQPPVSAGNAPSASVRLEEALPRLRPAIVALMQTGKKIEAIKLLRGEVEDLDLKDAKNAVERIEREAAPGFSISPTPAAASFGGGNVGAPIQSEPPMSPLRKQIIELLRAGNKIEAIKVIREATPGFGLKEAKEVVERIGREVGIN